MMFRTIGTSILLAAIFLSGIATEPALAFQQDDQAVTDREFWAAARNGALEKVKQAVESGLEVDVKTQYGATALFFACDQGHLEVVRFLLDKGADPNAKDTFYQATPVTWAQSKNRKEIIVELLKSGANGADQVLESAVNQKDTEYVQNVLKANVCDNEALVKARDAALDIDDEAVKSKILALFQPFELPEPERISVSTEVLKRYVGTYTNDQFEMNVTLKDDKLRLAIATGEPSPLKVVSETEFSLAGNTITFETQDNKVTALVAKFGDNEVTMKPKAAAPKSETETKPSSESKGSESSATASKQTKESPKFGPSSSKSRAEDLAVSSSNWPGFRGNGSRGVADGQNPPVQWSLDEDDPKNFLWKAEVPGLGLSCPTIWEDKIYLTSAVAEGEEGGLKIGLYGDVASVDEDREYEFKIFCYSRTNGKLLWERTSNKAKPAVKRHAKSSHANPTVATDGNYVIAFFGSEGLYCYSPTGELLWNRDLGFLDSGWFYDPGYQWGFGSSPIVREGKVIVQCDIQDQSFVAAIDLKTGEELWRTEREEIPGWASPLVHQFDNVTMLITSGTKSARGYNVDDGSLLWSLEGHSEIVVPTPNVAHGLIYVASGYSPIQPIYAIKPSARGNITLEEDTTTNGSIPWSVKRGGPYMPSPIIYGDYLYCCANSGILSCYRAKTGELVYKKRMKTGGGGLSFTASPLAADGHLYLTAEDGRVLVVKAGPEYELVETNRVNESVLATPAISKNAIYFRTQNSLIAVGTKP
ncbi:MAG: PQQ-binding-like beta-propeller repeat protein [Planctomycetota bacterium]